ncbi:MAG: hypothetical protein JWP61_2386 [Friedmanniella sp.]|nr:hypothetical protein [Friedmanniella sp.]
MIARVAARPRSQRALPWISTLVRLLLGGVFLTAGGLKAIDPSSSVAAVRAYQLLPEGLVTVVGWGLPFVEIALGLLLVVGVLTRGVAVVTGTLLCVFIVAVVSAAARGLSIDCGCFGGGGDVAPGQTSYTGEIIRDLGLLGLGAWLVWRPRSRLAVDLWDHDEGGLDVRRA